MNNMDYKMLEPSDFELSLEKQLRLRVIKTEIDECTDVKQLQENLKQCAESLMRFQNLASKLAEKQMLNLMDEFLDKLGVDVPGKTDG